MRDRNHPSLSSLTTAQLVVAVLIAALSALALPACSGQGRDDAEWSVPVVAGILAEAKDSASEKEAFRRLASRDRQDSGRAGMVLSLKDTSGRGISFSDWSDDTAAKSNTLILLLELHDDEGHGLGTVEHRVMQSSNIYELLGE